MAVKPGILYLAGRKERRPRGGAGLMRLICINWELGGGQRKWLSKSGLGFEPLDDKYTLLVVQTLKHRGHLERLHL